METSKNSQQLSLLEPLVLNPIQKLTKSAKKPVLTHINGQS